MCWRAFFTLKCFISNWCLYDICWSWQPPHKSKYWHFGTTLSELGISIAIAIAIHNIPEGISIAIPIYQATGSKKKAFWYTFFSGFAEPVGALIGYLLLNQFFSDAMFGFLFAGVGGIMVYISLDELLPTAERFGKHHLAITGVIIGMIIMAISLLLF